MANCTPEFWTLKEVREALERNWNGNKKIVIPMFQRGKRWDKKKKETFIDSLRKRYPVGTLLFYKTVEGSNEVYTLIDGLQRGGAIKEYLSNPSKFFIIDDFKKETIDAIYSLILDNVDNEALKSDINTIICDYINGVNQYENLETLDLFNLLSIKFPVLKNKITEFGNAVKLEFKKLKEDYNSLCHMTIPAIVYTGEEDTLPEIFERINSQGVALTEFEIYAASWPREEFTITNQEIIEVILKKYDLLNDNEYVISGYDRDEKRKQRNVNAFEYVFGLSKYLQSKYYSLNFYNNLKDDETNPVAFQILNACFNTSHAQIKDVYKTIINFKDNIDKLEQSLFASIDFVERCIDPILRFKGNNRSRSGKVFHSQFQIMSLISFVFRAAFNINDPNLSQNVEWNNIQRQLEDNIWKYYVFDIITKFWGEGGTNKIHTANTEVRYLKPISYGQFSTVYDSYSESMLSRKESTKILNPTTIDYVILNTIYLHSFSAMDQLSIDKFDVEHIATKAQMKNLIAKCKGEGLPISHIANLCYLPEYENRSKGSKNFYQDSEYLKKSNTKIEQIESKYSFTIKEDLIFMDLDYLETDFEVLKNYYVEEFLKTRNNVMKEKFLASLSLERPLTEDTKKSVINFELNSDQFYRVGKIGKVVQHGFSLLFNLKKLNDQEMTNLQNKQYSFEVLGCNYPVIVAEGGNLTDKYNHPRYYRESLSYNGKSYYLCKEWFEHNRKKVVVWLKEKLN